MRKLPLIAALGAAALALTACSGDTGGAAPGEDHIAVIAKGYASPFWATVKKGAEDAGKELGIPVDFRGPDTETDVDRQVNQMNQALVKKPKALVFAALDSKAQAAALSKWKDANIPVVAFDSGVPGSDIPLTTISTDNKAAAAEAAKKAVELTGGKGEIAIVCHSQTSNTGTDRRDGFKEYIEKNAPGMKIVDIQYNDSDQAKAQQQADAMLTAHPNLKVMFGTDDDGAVAAANVVKQKGKSEAVTVIGFDSGKVQMDQIRAGEIDGSVTQNPYLMGKRAVEVAYKVVKGEKPTEKFIDSGFAWYDKSNIDDPEIKKALYE